MPATADVPCKPLALSAWKRRSKGSPVAASSRASVLCSSSHSPIKATGPHGEMVNSRTREGNIPQEPRSCYSNRKKGSSQKTVEGTSETQPKESSESKVGQYKQRNITRGSYLENKIKIRKSILILINCRINECIVERRYSCQAEGV